MTKDANQSYYIKSGFYTLLQRLATLLFGFGSFFLLVRVLTKNEFGSWLLFQTITSIIEIGRNGLIQNAQIKFTSNATAEDYPKIMNASLSLNVILTFCTIILLWFGAPFAANAFNAPALTTMLRMYIVISVLLIPFTQFNFIQQSNLDFKGLFYTYVLRQGLFFVVIIYCYLASITIVLNNLVIWLTISSALASTLSYFFVKKYLKLSRKIHWDWVSKLFQYGKFTFGTNLSAMLFGSIDQFSLSTMIGNAAVATYGAAFRITGLVDVPISTVASVVFPQSARIIETEGKEGVKKLYESSVGLMMAIVLPIVAGTLIFAKYIVLIIAGAEYQDSVPVLQVAILFSLIQPYMRQFGTMMDSIGKPRLNFYVLLLAAVINGICNYLFIKQFGLMGAAYGTLAALSVCFAITSTIMAKELNTKFSATLWHCINFYKLGFNKLKSLLAR